MGIPFRQTKGFRKGRFGEEIVSLWLQTLGWYILPAYDYTGNKRNKAPRLKGIADSLIVPDLLLARGGESRWGEVKTKAKADFTYMTQRYEHGIPLRHYRHYLRVQHVTGIPVWLLIYELKTGALFWKSLDSLSWVCREYHGYKMNSGGMAFFPRDIFDLLTMFPSL